MARDKQGKIISGADEGNPFTSDNQPTPEAKSEGKKRISLMRSGLKDLLRGLVRENKKDITHKEKALIYEIYNIALCDYAFPQNANIGIKHLYFFISDFGIKVGVSNNVKSRLNQIKSYAPSSEIIKVIPYASNFEFIIHKKFKSQNIKGNPTYGIEWFFINDDLLNFIDSINSVNDLMVCFNKRISKDLQMKLF
jgi:hypothetical protein